MMIENYAIDAIDAFLQTWLGEEALQKQKIAAEPFAGWECRRTTRWAHIKTLNSAAASRPRRDLQGFWRETCKGLAGR